MTELPAEGPVWEVLESVTGDNTLFDPNGSGARYPNGTWTTYSNRAGIPTTFYLDGI